MHASELVRAILGRVPFHSEAERAELVAAVDVAFPLPEAEPEDGTPDDGQAPAANPSPAKAK